MISSKPTILEQIAVRAAGGVRIHPGNRQAALHAIADTLACAVVGAQNAATRAVREGLGLDRGAGSGPCTLVGGGRAAPADAAFLNATAAHALDFDDNFAPGMSHASAVMVPALLALGQQRGASGGMLVEAYLAGLEAQALVGQGVRPEHYAAGWHATSTVGAIGSAAGAAVLLGLDRTEIVQAMSLAVSSACGVKGQFGTPAKPFHAGLAARNAVQAALFAEAGLTGRTDILERQQGFGELLGGGAAEWTIPGPDVPHVIETDGLAPKIHPCCGSTHNSVDIVLNLRHAHGFRPEEVRTVRLTVGRANYRNLAFPNPVTEMEARFSMQYCVALALHQDALSIADFTPEAVGRPHLRKLFDRISMAAMPLDEERASERPAHRAEIELEDGRVLTAARAHARGTIHDPLEDTDRAVKLRDCFVTAGLPFDAETGALLRRVDAEPDLSRIGALLSRAPEAVPA